jgi:hypothetical protein
MGHYQAALMRVAFGGGDPVSIVEDAA